MSVFKNSFSVAAEVTPSDDVNIPYPNIVKTGVIDAVTAGRLVDSTVNFVDLGIKVGDTVISHVDNAYAYVTGVYPGYLSISVSYLFSNIGDTYGIYQGENNGCYIYIGDVSGGTDLDVETIGGNIVIFSNLSAGQILPVQVKKVRSGSSVGKLIALW